ncbi:MAG: serine/threonine-protein phosphatase [Anaerolineae bacterium]|nr:serine/threonine-protein phosphatase [Anaerolineae bacterium]
MHLSVAVAKIDKWAVQSGGDTLEMIERPNGGLSLVLADGQSSGPGAKRISLGVVRKVVADLAEGVRDGAAARAANDTLYALRKGKVAATLVILSADLESRDLVITRCGDPPVFVREPEGVLRALDDKAPPLGFYRYMRPMVKTLPLSPGLLVCAFTDGLLHAGSRKGAPMDIGAMIDALWLREKTAQGLANGLLEHAMALDDGRPNDDTSIVVLLVNAGEGTGPRYMRVEMPAPDA